MERTRAAGIAKEIVEALVKYCTRIQIGGSLRRCKPEVKDIEIVYVSKMEPLQGSLFGEEDQLAPMADFRLGDLVKAGMLAWDLDTPRNGPKYKRFIHCESGMVVELFRATEENWGVILALRTGDAGFSKLLVTPTYQGGVMPFGMRMDQGFLWKMGYRLESSTETEFFEQLGLPWIKPQDRNVDTLRRYVVAKAANAVPTLLNQEWMGY